MFRPGQWVRATQGTVWLRKGEKYLVVDSFDEDITVRMKREEDGTPIVRLYSSSYFIFVPTGFGNWYKEHR